MSDKDSLFGSPPPSPSIRGRSPSLALPELPAVRLDGQASSQNVGTIALPGSHEYHSELPVFVDIALPREQPKKLSLRPPAAITRARSPPTRRRVASNTSRRTRSPPRLPSPVPHNPQTDRTLLDLVGLISHFEPGTQAPGEPPRPPPATTITTTLNKSSPTARLHAPGTAQNPIEIDPPRPVDAVNSALVALAGTVASALKLPTAPKDVPSLSKPTVNNVLQIIKHDPKLIPVLQATYDYLGSVPTHQPPRSFSHVTTNNPDPSSKRRHIEKGSTVPAGAGHWDVPFPFAPGKGPKDYPSQWQLERGRRVLGDLLGLFERAFAQARGDKVVPVTSRPRKRRKIGREGSSVESARSDFDESAYGTIDQRHAPSGSKDTSPLDHKRMNEWLSSVPALSASSSIIESTVNMTCPSPSEPAPVPDSLQDLMAMLGPFPENHSTTPVDDKDSSFDFDGTFDDIGIDQNDAQWKSLFDFGPLPQSINDITAFPMGLQDKTSQPPASQPLSQSTQSYEPVIDPALMALSQQPPAPPCSSSSGLDRILQSNTTSTDTGTLPRDTDMDFKESTPLSHPESHARSDLNFSLERDSCQSNPQDARSLLTVPTTSASSSQGCSRHGSAAPTDIHAPSVASSTASSKAERKAAALAKAKEHRARLLREIEEAKTERWETVIEGGVLRNLQKVGKP